MLACAASIRYSDNLAHYALYRYNGVLLYFTVVRVPRISHPCTNLVQLCGLKLHTSLHKTSGSWNANFELPQQTRQTIQTAIHFFLKQAMPSIAPSRIKWRCLNLTPKLWYHLRPENRELIMMTKRYCSVDSSSGC